MSTQKTSPPENLRKPNDNHVAWLLRRIWDRINRRNEHFMGVIVGREGSGKSYTAVRIASEVDPTFNADRVIFDVADLLEVLKDGDHEPGNWYVLDEAGVQLGRRSWQERSQILANQALQLIRDHNLGLLFTLPRMSEFDSQAEGRIQAVYEIKNKEADEYVEGKWFFYDPDRLDDSGTIYRKYPRRRNNGQLMRVKNIRIGPPDIDIIEPYQEKKTKFQENFYQETIDEIRGEEAEEQEEEKTVKDVAQEVVEDPEGMGKYVSEHGRTGEPYFNKNMIRVELELTHSDARAVKKLLEKRFDTEELERYV